mgnify:CR=1 FL=1
MKPSFKMKPFFKQALKMLVMFVGMFMLMFTILMIVVVITAHAAEPQTESTTSVEQTENGLEESEEETEAPSRTGGGHHVNDTEKTADEETLSDENLSDIVQDMFDSVLNPTESIDEDFTLDEDEEQVSSGNTIIVYQVSPTAESSSEMTYYGSLEEYEEGETPALTYGEYVINKKPEYICILSAFMTGFEFISMIASWRKR